MTIRHDDHHVTWFGYATTRIETPDGRVIYLDPGRYGVLDGHAPGDGDLVCVTHDHHYDSAGIRAVAGPEATVVVYEGVDPARIDRAVDPIEELPGDVRRIGEGETLSAARVEVTATPAHNEPDGPHTREDGTPFHPEGFGVGYHLDLGDRTAFWPGDTDVLETHEDVETSLFLPPIGGSFTMDRREAASLAATLDPDLVLPIHYNTFEALETDERAFAADVAGRGVPVVLEDPDQ
jgi:L-ascorbate metabolism protein UlaG (beta-lactamase superfamily)